MNVGGVAGGAAIFSDLVEHATRCDVRVRSYFGSMVVVVLQLAEEAWKGETAKAKGKWRETKKNLIMREKRREEKGLQSGVSALGITEQ